MKRTRIRPLLLTASVCMLLTAAFHPAPEAGDPEAGTPVPVVQGLASEQPPRLLGGLEELQKQLRYPQEARRLGVEGTVVLGFDVDEAGHVQAPTVLRGLGYGVDAEALRVLQTARFRPALQNGRPVRVTCTLPITFRLTSGR